MNTGADTSKGVSQPITPEKRVALFERMADLFEAISDNWLNSRTSGPLIIEAARAFREIMGENPDIKALESAKEDFFKALDLDTGVDRDRRKRMAESVYTRILERIVTCGRSETLQPIDLNTAKPVAEIVRNARRDISTVGGGAH